MLEHPSDRCHHFQLCNCSWRWGRQGLTVGEVINILGPKTSLPAQPGSYIITPGVTEAFEVNVRVSPNVISEVTSSCCRHWSGPPHFTRELPPVTQLNSSEQKSPAIPEDPATLDDAQHHPQKFPATLNSEALVYSAQRTLPSPLHPTINKIHLYFTNIRKI